MAPGASSRRKALPAEDRTVGGERPRKTNARRSEPDRRYRWGGSRWTPPGRSFRYTRPSGSIRTRSPSSGSYDTRSGCSRIPAALCCSAHRDPSHLVDVCDQVGDERVSSSRFEGQQDSHDGRGSLDMNGADPRPDVVCGCSTTVRRASRCWTGDPGTPSSPEAGQALGHKALL